MNRSLLPAGRVRIVLVLTFLALSSGATVDAAPPKKQPAAAKKAAPKKEAAKPAADSASAHELALELMKLTNVEQTLAGMRAQIDDMMAAQLQSLNVPESKKDRVEQHRKKINALVSSEMSYAKMKDAYADLYVSLFSLDDLRGIVAFYGSPAGKAYVQNEPELVKKVMLLAQQRMQKVAPQVQQLNSELLAELKKETPKAPE